jgi:hypothetical protein
MRSVTGPSEVTKVTKFSRKLHSAGISRHQVSRPQSLYLLQSVFAFESDGVTDGIISPVGELSEKGLRPGEALTRRGVELRSRPVGRVTDGTRTRNSQNHNLELYH